MTRKPAWHCHCEDRQQRSNLPANIVYFFLTSPYPHSTPFTPVQFLFALLLGRLTAQDCDFVFKLVHFLTESLAERAFRRSAPA